MINESDYLVIGSGAAGIMAAQTLVESGKHVTILDAATPVHETASVPKGRTFMDLHRHDPDQWKYLLGEEFECLYVDEIGTGPHLTAGRKHLVEGVDTWIPSSSASFQSLESLASGGLGQAWGLGSFVYSNSELEAAGMPLYGMRMAYQTVVDRIGVSAGQDDLSSWIMDGITGVMPPVRRDRLTESIYRRYLRRKDWFAGKGIHMGSPALAMLTQPYRGRRAISYDELEFYHDDGSAWRPSITLKELQGKENFNHITGLLAVSFHESEGQVILKCIRRADGIEENITANKLILAGGALSTARIAMRSLNITRLPLLCNPYSYLPSIFPSHIGKAAEEQRSALAQAMLLIDRGSDGTQNVMVSLYTYGSLLLYRLAQEVPWVPFKEAIRIMRYLQPSLLIAGIHHPDMPCPEKYVELHPDSESPTKDRMHFYYSLTESEIRQHKNSIALVRKALRSLGGIPIGTTDPGFGSSIHYGGTLPFKSGEENGYQSIDGRLHGSNHVYIADASGFRYLPAKGITLSIMANAHRVASSIP